MKTLCLPVDGSDAAKATLAWALTTFTPSQHHWQFVSVVPKTDPQAVIETYQVEEALNAVNGAKATTEAAGGTVTKAEYIEAGPAEGIITFATNTQPDLLVIGSHGRTGLAKVVMGSVSQRVFAESPVPVVLYRNVK